MIHCSNCKLWNTIGQNLISWFFLTDLYSLKKQDTSENKCRSNQLRIPNANGN